MPEYISSQISAFHLVVPQYVYVILEVYQNYKSVLEQTGRDLCFLFSEYHASVHAIWDCVRLLGIHVTVDSHSMCTITDF